MRRDYKSRAFALSRRKFGRQCRDLEPYHALVRDHREVACKQIIDLSPLPGTGPRNFPPLDEAMVMPCPPRNVRSENQPFTIARCKIDVSERQSVMRTTLERRLVAVRRRRRAPV